MFLSTYQPNPVLFDLGIIQVHWYGLILALAIAGGFLVLRKLFVEMTHNVVQNGKTIKFYCSYKTKQDGALRGMSRRNVPTDFIVNLFFYTIIWAIIGGRLFHILTFLNYYLKSPLEIFAIWHGGISFYGVFVFGLISLFYFSKKISVTSYQLPITNYFKQRLINFLFLLDIIVPALALAQPIGRWGNWFNQEIFGPPCDLFWCIPIDLMHRPLEYLAATHFHPVFLYESILMFLVFILLFRIFERIYSSPISMINDEKVTGEKKETNNNIKNATMKQCNNGKILCHSPGVIFAMYLLLHGLIRFILEFLRLDVQPVLFSLRIFQWFALVEFIFGLVLFFVMRSLYCRRRRAVGEW